jgi:hypothetical protein
LDRLSTSLTVKVHFGGFITLPEEYKEQPGGMADCGPSWHFYATSWLQMVYHPKAVLLRGAARTRQKVLLVLWCKAWEPQALLPVSVDVFFTAAPLPTPIVFPHPLQQAPRNPPTSLPFRSDTIFEVCFLKTLQRETQKASFSLRILLLISKGKHSITKIASIEK